MIRSSPRNVVLQALEGQATIGRREAEKHKSIRDKRGPVGTGPRKGKPSWGGVERTVELLAFAGRGLLKINSAYPKSLLRFVYPTYKSIIQILKSILDMKYSYGVEERKR